MLCVICVLVSTVSAMASISMKVNKKTQFYRSPSKSSECVDINKGVKLEMTGFEDGWARVTCQGVTGYMELKYLKGVNRLEAYASQNTYVYAKASTSSDKMAVDANTKVYVIGKDGSFSIIQNKSGTITCFIETKCLSDHKVTTDETTGDTVDPADPSSWKHKVVKLDWYNGGSSVLKRGKYGYIYDIKTGLIVHIKRMGGVSHADVEPATKTDTAKLLKIAGGKFSWDSKAVILYAGGQFVACAINTMPHGDQTLSDNGYDGQFCLHMLGSKTHGSDSINEEHQKSIIKAYNWAH